MKARPKQLDLFHSLSLDPTYPVKRALRVALSNAKHLSRDQVVDKMNKLASREGKRKKVSKATLDNWTKNSDPDRIPSLFWMTVFCKVVGDVSPIACMLRPLDCDVVDESGKKYLRWAKAEMTKRKAAKRAKHALSALEDF